MKLISIIMFRSRGKMKRVFMSELLTIHSLTSSLKMLLYLWLIEVGKIKVQIEKKLNRMKVKGLVRKEKSKNRDRPNQSGLWTVL